MNKLKNNIKLIKKIKKNNNNKFPLIDVISCYFNIKSNLTEYYKYDLNNLNKEQKVTFLTNRKNNELIYKLNNPAFFYKIDNKEEFNKNFITINKIENFKQNNKLNELCNDLIKIKFITFYDGNKSHILQSVIEIGNLIAYLNDTGTIITPAFDKDNKVFGIHPISKKQFLGFKVPLFSNIKETALKYSEINKKLKYMSWTFIIEDNNLYLLEASYKPKIFQTNPKFSKDKKGILPKYEQIMKIKI